MRVQISAKNLKSGLKFLKQVNDCHGGGNSETAYALEQRENGVYLYSSGIYVSMSYLLAESGEGFEKPMPIDAGLLAALKFPEDAVQLEFFDSFLRATCKNFTAELKTPAAGYRFQDKGIPLSFSFATADFLEALSFHEYGAHHNPLEAEKRHVKISPKDGAVHLESFDKQVCAFNQLRMPAVLDQDLHLLPKPVIAALSNVTDETFQMGMNKNAWTISTPKLSVTFPNSGKLGAARNFDQILSDVADKPSVKLTFDKAHIKEALSVLSPVAKGKDENPKMSLYPRHEGKVDVTVSSDKINALNFALDALLIEDGLAIDGSSVSLNFKYTKEFVDRLDGDKVTFQYWKYNDKEAPVQGKAVSFFTERGRYIIARITL